MRNAKSRLNALQMVGAIVLIVVANPISLIFALTLPGLIVPLLAYVAASVALWVGSSAAFRAGRTTLA